VYQVGINKGRIMQQLVNEGNAFLGFQLVAKYKTNNLPYASAR